MNDLDQTLLAENREILARFEAEGSDLSDLRVIDFEHLFDRRHQAEGFLRIVETQGYTATLFGRDDGQWDAQASREMMPTAEEITLAEQTLGLIAADHGGKADGWGFFRSDP